MSRGIVASSAGGMEASLAVTALRLAAEFVSIEGPEQESTGGPVDRQP